MRLLQVEPARLLPGWSSIGSDDSSDDSSGSGDAAAATDSLVLSYSVPWPLSLLVGEQQLSQYAAVFSVLLRLRRLQHLLTLQWPLLNSRAGHSGSGSQARRQQQQAAHGSEAALALGRARLQQLRRWHALARHCCGGLLGHMLGQLSGQLWVEFEQAVASQAVSLAALQQAHCGLLAAAREVCLLPRSGASSGGGGGGVTAVLCHRVVGEAWRLQQHVAALLQGAGDEGGGGVLAATLGEAASCWDDVHACAAALERQLRLLRKQLSACAAAGSAHQLAGLAARLGV